jgi:elongation factor Ts
MVQVSVDAIKMLRARTSAGIMDCKRALEEAGGDVDKAEESLRQSGIIFAGKKAHRDASEGVVECYIHTGNRVGAMVELNCETDFVARTQDFKDLAHNLAMQVAAMAPLYVDKEGLPPDDKVNPEEACLLEQPFIKDSAKAVGELITDLVARVGENIRVKRFERFVIGE